MTSEPKSEPKSEATNPSSNSKNNRREQIFINPRAQVYMIMHAVLFGACFLIAYISSEYFFFERFRMTVESASVKDTTDMLYYLHEYQWLKVMFVLGCSLLLLVLATLQTLYVSHRVCGPVHKVITHIEENLKGESSREIKLREGDFFEELAESVNKLFRRQKR